VAEKGLEKGVGADKTPGSKKKEVLASTVIPLVETQK